jgi:hypothetical protein
MPKIKSKIWRHFAKYCGTHLSTHSSVSQMIAGGLHISVQTDKMNLCHNSIDKYEEAGENTCLQVGWLWKDGWKVLGLAQGDRHMQPSLQIFQLFLWHDCTHGGKQKKITIKLCLSIVSFGIMCCKFFWFATWMLIFIFIKCLHTMSTLRKFRLVSVTWHRLI